METDGITQYPEANEIHLAVHSWKIGTNEGGEVLLILGYRDARGTVVKLPVGMLRPDGAEAIGNGLLQCAREARQRKAISPAPGDGTQRH